MRSSRIVSNGEPSWHFRKSSPAKNSKGHPYMKSLPPTVPNSLRGRLVTSTLGSQDTMNLVRRNHSNTIRKFGRRLGEARQRNTLDDWYRPRAVKLIIN